MSIDEIQHLDDISPFDAIAALDTAIAIYRKALASSLARTTYDAVRSSEESDMIAAGTYLWSARESLVAAVEADCD